MQRIPLNHCKFALVDDEVYTLVSSRNWHAALVKGIWYARTNIRLPSGRKTLIDMHRFIMNAKTGQRVDHADGDGLNNTGGNLRFCTHLQNMRNRHSRSPNKTSRFHGVSWNRPRQKWVAQIKADRARLVGAFSDEADAARAYDAAAIQHFGEFASTNFPRSNYVNQ